MRLAIRIASKGAKVGAQVERIAALEMHPAALDPGGGEARDQRRG
ncbi:MAG: hypothetical protein WDN28_10920 [Chthoniobacter sp.]